MIIIHVEKGSSIYELVHSYFISHDLDIVPTIECTNPHALIELVKQNDGIFDTSLFFS